MWSINIKGYIISSVIFENIYNYLQEGWQCLGAYNICRPKDESLNIFVETFYTWQEVVQF